MIEARSKTSPPANGSGGAGRISDSAFNEIARIAHSEAGLLVPETKRTLVQSRISKRIRARGLGSFEEYLELIATDEGAEERTEMICALTTNVSSFFRENHHFDALKGLAPRLMDRARTGNAVRIWSAGCSSGQEPYSVAMTLIGEEPSLSAHNFRILATDIDRNILSVAERAIYSESQISDISPERRTRFFEPSEAGTWMVREELRKLVTFRTLNLLHPWPMRMKYDVIFCRNVMIYFDEATQASLWGRFSEALVPGGFLFLGHSERIVRPETVGLISEGLTSYQRIGAAEEKIGRSTSAKPTTLNGE